MTQKPDEEREGIREKSSCHRLDLTKNLFQLHGAAANGTVVFREKLSPLHFHRFMSEHPRCVMAMEACSGALRRTSGWCACWNSRLPTVTAFVLTNKMPHGNRATLFEQ